MTDTQTQQFLATLPFKINAETRLDPGGCKNGHVPAIRYAKNNVCVQCSRQHSANLDRTKYNTPKYDSEYQDRLRLVAYQFKVDLLSLFEQLWEREQPAKIRDQIEDLAKRASKLRLLKKKHEQ